MTSAAHEATPLIGMHLAVRVGNGGHLHARVTGIVGDDLLAAIVGGDTVRIPPEQWREWLANMGRAKVTL